MTAPSHPLRWLIRAVIIALVAVGLGLGSMDPAIGWVIPMALLGGGLTAAVLMATRSRDGHTPFLPDRFQGEGPIGVMNLSRVRVAGFGGVGLLVAAGLVALEYELTTVALAAGIAGGAVTGVVMILYRRRHRTSRHEPGHLL